MPVTCDAQSLATAAKGYEELSDRELVIVQTFLLAQIYSTVSGISVSASQLATLSASFAKLGTEDLAAVQTYLLCQIASVSGA